MIIHWVPVFLSHLLFVLFFVAKGFKNNSAPLKQVMISGLIGINLLLPLITLQPGTLSLYDFILSNLIFVTFTFQFFAVTQRSVSLNLLLLLYKSKVPLSNDEIMRKYRPDVGFNHIFESRFQGLVDWNWIQLEPQASHWILTPTGRLFKKLHSIGIKLLFLKRGQFGWVKKTLSFTFLAALISIPFFKLDGFIFVMILGCFIIVVGANLMNSISFQILYSVPDTYPSLLEKFNIQDSLFYRLQGLSKNQFIHETPEKSEWKITEKGKSIARIFYFFQTLLRFEQTG